MATRNPAQKRPPQLDLPAVITVTWGQSVQKKTPLKNGDPCIFCGEYGIDKVYAEGCLVRDGQIVWRYRGVVHLACKDKARAEAAREFDKQ